MKIEKKKKLKKFNFYNLDVTAKYFVELKKKKDFEEVFSWMDRNDIKKSFIIGEGSNIIFKKDFFDGVVIKISNNFLCWNDKDVVGVGAGKNLDTFLLACQKKDIFEIQSLSSIPGSVGAGVFGNVGAFGTEIKKFIFGVWVFDIFKRKFIFVENRESDFSYRNSFFKKNKNKFLIYSVIFDFSNKFHKEIKFFYKEDDYFSLRHFAKKYNLKSLKKQNLRTEIKKIRRNIYPNIEKFPNVGSTFKNAEITKRQFKKISQQYPKIPNWEQKSGKIKIPTAYIFDKILNLNGKKIGNIQIDSKRPLFFINTGDGTGKEFFKLCQKIKKDTEKKLGIKVEEEVFFVE